MFCTFIRLSWPINLESSFTDLSVETALFGLGRDASSSEITVYEKNISDESTKQTYSDTCCQTNLSKSRMPQSVTNKHINSIIQGMQITKD